MSAPDTALISAAELRRTFDHTVAIDTMDFSIPSGSLTAVIGPSRSGKTTMIRLLLGILSPTSGSIRTWDVTSAELSRSQRRRIGYLPTGRGGRTPRRGDHHPTILQRRRVVTGPAGRRGRLLRAVGPRTAPATLHRLAAALSLMRDRRLGLMEVFQAGPAGSGVILLGKYLAYLAAGLVVGALLLAATTIGLGVNIVGSLGWTAAGMTFSLLASLSPGLVVALIARSDVQAVQVSMLVLLLGLFLGGFFLDLDTLRHPIRDIAWLMPVTFTIRLLQDVMLRGNQPATIDLVGLAAQCVGYAALAWWLLARQLRVD